MRARYHDPLPRSVAPRLKALNRVENVVDVWTWPAIALAAGVVVGVGIVTTVGILLLEAQRRRDQRASAFQNLLAEPIAHELDVAGVSVLPTVRIPLWKASTRPAEIQLTGQVPSREIHDRVIRLVEREASRLRYFRIEDRIRIAQAPDERQHRLA
jgi:hypothetical protein